MNYDYDIRKTFDDTLGEDAMYNLYNNVSDYDMLRIATELLRNATERLSNDLDNEKINEEYYNLIFIINNLEKIIDNYV